jgi:hypothetical protein
MTNLQCLTSVFSLIIVFIIGVKFDKFSITPTILPSYSVSYDQEIHHKGCHDDHHFWRFMLTSFVMQWKYHDINLHLFLVYVAQQQNVRYLVRDRM